MQLLVPVNEAMQSLGVGRTKLYQLISEREIELVKIGTRSLITVASLEAFVARLSEAIGHDH